jgi:signal recognition particle receptor subunit beta
LVLLINNTSESVFADLDHYIDAFSDFIEKTYLVIGVTHMDKVASPTINQYYQYISKKYKNYPIFEVDARKERDIKILLQALLYSLR